LVTGQECPISQISSLDLRKIYFGFRVERENSIFRAYRNRGDERLEAIFLQSVVSMSRKSYRRRLLWLSLNYGNPNLSEFTETQEFVAQLKKWPCAVSYMWEEDILLTKGLKALDLLWESD